MLPTLHIADETAMEALGGRLAAACAGGCLIHLRGDLGAGKTTFTRGFLRRLGHEGPVKSPTYTLVEPYEPGGRRVFHLDLYRLGDPGELEYIGLRDLLDDDSLCLVEWPEQGEGMLPPADVEVIIDYAPQGREVRLVAHTRRGAAVLDLLS
jgi:tRNA threonylcarbamoyladenosine biosynthesis protein TsaE